MRSNFRRKAKRELYRSRRIIMRGEAPVNQVSSATPLYLITRPQKHPPHSFCATPPPSSFLDRERYVPVSGNRPPSDRIGRYSDRNRALRCFESGRGSNLVSGRTARDNQRLYIYNRTYVWMRKREMHRFLFRRRKRGLAGKET